VSSLKMKVKARNGNVVRVGVRRQVGDLRLVAQRHAERRAALLEDREQRLPGHAREAVAGGGQHLPAVVDVDVVPVGEGAGDRGVSLRVRLAEVVERRVREHDAEAERVLGPVALHDGDVVRGVGVLHEDREVEPRRAPADGDDLHALIVVARSPVVARTTRDSGAYNRG
jgi:hypothetical protein